MQSRGAALGVAHDAFTGRLATPLEHLFDTLENRTRRGIRGDGHQLQLRLHHRDQEDCRVWA